MELQILHAGVSHPSPYFYNFCEALKEVNPEIDLSLNPNLPPKGPKDRGILHFHRLKRFYNSNDQKSAENFIEELKSAKKSGWKIAWTIHNFFPIDREISDVDFWTTKEFSSLGDVLFTHTELMKTNAEKLFSREVINSSFGINNLEGIFDKNKIALAKKDSDFIFTFVGNIAKYKCIPEIIENFKELQGEFNDSKLKLIIAGPSLGEFEFGRDVQNNQNISIYNFFIGNSAWKELNRVTDAYLGTYDLSLPAFKYGFFPSSVPQILSYKKVMILPDCPEIREFIPNDNLAAFYNYYTQGDLFKTMKSLIDSPRKSLIEKNLEKIVYNPSWKEAVKTVNEGYKHILAGS